ncbi:MAG: hypothetical protein AB7O24_07515 [Kofleriaceae bacterium]
MRLVSLVTVSLLCACTFRAPRGISLRVSGSVRADVRVQGRVTVDRVVVPLQGAPVAEFFGIPLADARDVLFVLDVSGSMNELAAGQLALIAPPPPPPPPDSQPPEPTTATNSPAATNSAPIDPIPADAVPPPPPPPLNPPPQPMGYPPGYPSSTMPPPGQPEAPPETRIATRVPTKIEVARAELIDALARLPAGTRMNLLIFSNEVDAYAPNLVIIDDANRTDTIAFVREMTADGATALQPAMRMAFLLNAPRIVLLSDGLGNIGGDQGDILRDLREAIRGGVRIDTIGIGPDQDTKLLTTLAAETGGLYQRF